MKHILSILLLISASLLAQEKTQVIPFADLGNGPEITSSSLIPGGHYVMVTEKTGETEQSFLTNLSTLRRDSLGYVARWAATSGDFIVFQGGGKAKPVIRYALKDRQSDTLQTQSNGFDLIGNYGCIITYPKKGKSENGARYKLISFHTVKKDYRLDTLSAYVVTDDKRYIIAASCTRNGAEILRIDTGNGQVIVLSSVEGNPQQLIVSRNGLWVALAYDQKLLLVNSKVNKTTSIQIPKGWRNLAIPKPFFSGENGNLFVYLEHVVGKEESRKDDGIDIWDWRDVSLVSAETRKTERKQLQKYLWYVPLNGKMQHLENDTLQKIRPVGDGSHFLVGIVEYPYLLQRSWESGKIADYYLLDLEKGITSLFLKASGSFVNSSPGGKYLYWFGNDSTWYTYNLATSRQARINIEGDDQFFNVLFDEPSSPGPYAAEGWTENDGWIILKGFYDLYMCDPNGEKPAVCLTNGNGRKNNMQFRVSESSKKQGLKTGKSIIVEGFSLTTKQSGLFRLILNKSINSETIIWGDFKVGGVKVSEDGKSIIYTAEAYGTYPDLMLIRAGGHPQQITNIGDYYSRYAWGSVRLIAWKNPEGGMLHGMLYLPDSANWKHPYPLVVNIYERKSDNLNLFIKPALSEAEINIPYYVSNGYAVFIPDIIFRIGDPGESSYSCTQSGLSYIFSHFSVLDSTRVGIQGHSWGAYQTAFLLTRMHCFKVAVAMAPVSNMVSAYGAIRPGMGNSRMFQYESGQSRIGKTLWQDPSAYIKHSTVLYTDRITTPLLIIANDGDGAVPWEQGMELFLAMRRLSKPCWMVNYKGDAHVLNKKANKEDFTRRMMDMFGYYLKDKPAPEWITRNTNLGL